MINQLTFQEESPRMHTHSGMGSIRSPPSQRIVEQIIVGASTGGDSPVRQRIINFQGHLSKDLLLKLDERFLETEQMLASRMQGQSPAKTMAPSPRVIMQPMIVSAPPSNIMPATPETTLPSPRNHTPSKSPSKTRPFCSEYVIRLNSRRRQAEELMRQYEQNRNRLKQLIASSQRL